MTEFTRELILSLADIPIASTKGMGQGEAIAGVAQMISDLQDLAQKDGCIAAGWALEILTKVSQFEPEPTKATTTIYRLFHWWDGDRFSDPDWVHSGDFSSEQELERKKIDLKGFGFKDFRTSKITTVALSQAKSGGCQ